MFCLCGQLTERGLAEPNPVYQMRMELDRAVVEGVRRVTFLGGEPTLQSGFDDLMAYAATLGFEEITIFTNGARTGKRDFIERITSFGPFTWRFSIQGGDEVTHDRNTKRPGSFRRIVHGMAVLQELGQRITVNTCVNGNNVDSLPMYPALLAQYGVVQFHADMVRPHSTGERSEEEVASLVPDYGVVRARMTEMMEGFERLGSGIEVNIGNLPYCVLPEFARIIEHGGEFTWTISGDGGASLRDPLDKYSYQREAHGFLPSCASCLTRPRCKGLPDVMLERGDLALIQPVSLATLRAVSPARRDLRAVVGAYLAQLSGVAEPESSDWALDVLGGDANGVDVNVRTPSGTATFHFGPPPAPRALARSRDFSLVLRMTRATASDTARAFAVLVKRLSKADLGVIEPTLSGAELVESLMLPDDRKRGVLELRHALLRLRRVTNGPNGLRFGKTQSLSEEFGVGIPVHDANGSAGQVRLVLGAGQHTPVHVEFDGCVSQEAQKHIFAAAVAGSVPTHG
ncbi:MAG: radical SAM protein [Sandaracinaceae bacterium]|nr:radical SAM protein [Sandaracinaceae bacterium]